MPPCNHYKSSGEVMRQNINEENEDEDAVIIQKSSRNNGLRL